MKLRDKEADSTFILKDPTTGETWEVDPEDYLTERQYRKMSSCPYIALAFAHHLAAQARQEGHGQIEVRAQVWAIAQRPRHATPDRSQYGPGRPTPNPVCIGAVDRATSERSGLKKTVWTLSTELRRL